jgi:hypothetical protein
MWHEGNWTFQISGSLPTAATISTAQKMVAYLSTKVLPDTPGFVAVEAAGVGDHTYAAWVQGKVVYNVWDYHHALGTLKMALSMTSAVK